MLSDQEDKDSTLTVHLRVGLHHLLDLVEARLLVMLGGGATAEKTLPPSDMISQNLDFYYDRHESVYNSYYLPGASHSHSLTHFIIAL